MEDEALTIYCSSSGTFVLDWLGGRGRCHDGARTSSPPTTPASSFRHRGFQYRKQCLYFSNTASIPSSPCLGCRKVKLTSIFTGTEPCKFFCVVVCHSSSTALTDTLWTDHIRKTTTHHLWWFILVMGISSINIDTYRYF